MYRDGGEPVVENQSPFPQIMSVWGVGMERGGDRVSERERGERRTVERKTYASR